MSLNITNLLTTLQQYYDAQNNGADKSAASKDNIDKALKYNYGQDAEWENWSKEAGFSEENTYTVTKDQSVTIDLGNGKSIKVSSEIEQSFCYKKNDDTGMAIIYGSNLTIDMPVGEENLVEVIGICNTINTNDKDDTVSIIGYGNVVNAGDNTETTETIGETEETTRGVDTVNTLGGSTTSKETEIMNVFDADSVVATGEADDIFSLKDLGIEADSKSTATSATDGKFTVTDDGLDIEIDGKKYTISINHTETDDEEKITSVDVSYELKDKVITFTASNIDISVDTEGQEDNIKIVGNNCRVNTGSGKTEKDEDNNDILVGASDEVTIVGDNNIVHTGDGNDTVYVEGSTNEIYTDAGEDDTVEVKSGKQKKIEAEDVSYTGNSATIVLENNCDPQYIKVGGFEYTIERNTDGIEDTEDDITVSYSYNEKTGVFEFYGSNFIITAQDVDEEHQDDKITVKSNNDKTIENVKILTGSGDDTITATGDNIVVYSGDGTDNITVTGNESWIEAGADNDTITVTGENTQRIDGGDGEDTLNLYGTIGKANENILNVEKYGDTITLSKENQFQTVTVGNKTYTFNSAIEFETTTTDESGEEITKQNTVTIEYSYDVETGLLTVIGNNLILKAGNGQEDNIYLEGDHSKIFTLDKNDTIDVKGSNNFIDGWTGSDKITAEGRNNKVYGFTGNDEITIVETEIAEDDEELATEIESLTKQYEDDETKTEEVIEELARENLEKKYASTVDGEFGKDTVSTNKYYTNISVDTEVYKYKDVLNLNMIISPDDKEKEIVIDDKTYIVTNYASSENPFTADRTISYAYDTDTDQLIVKGDYISVVAKDGQDDNVKIIGNNSFMNLGDGNDTLEMTGNYNLLFGGLGDDTLTVDGKGNKIYGGDKAERKLGTDNNTFYVNGDDNQLVGGYGTDTATIDGENIKWRSIEFFEGKDIKGETLTAENKYTTTITLDDNKKYTITANIKDDDKPDAVSFTYTYEDDETGNKILSVNGDNIVVTANSGQTDNIKLNGKNCIIDAGDGDDTIDVKGSDVKVLGGAGNDNIKVYGQDFTIEDKEGINTYDVRATDTTVTGSGSDTLAISGNKTTTYSGIKTVDNHPETGTIIFTAESKTDEIRYKDKDGKEIVVNIAPYSSTTGESTVTGEILYADYTVETDENGNKQLVVEGSHIEISTSVSDANNIYMKVEGEYNYIHTGMGNDEIEVTGNSNKIETGEGKNTINVVGNENNIKGGTNIDTFNIKGDNNAVIGGASSKDDVHLEGNNNTYQVTTKSLVTQQSITLTKYNTPYILVVGTETQKRVYKLGLYNSSEQEEFKYSLVDDYIEFEANNVSIIVSDVEETQTTDKVATDNRDWISLKGNNCYLMTGFGNDAVKVVGNNNTLDGWYGDDSFDIIEGSNNTIIGLNGDDSVIIDKGDNNKFEGDQGNDTLTINENTVTGTVYENVENIVYTKNTETTDTTETTEDEDAEEELTT